MGSRQESAGSLEATGTLSYTHPLSDRRAAPRHKQMFVSQMTPWSPGHSSIPFEVIVEDISDSGVGVIAERPARLGMRHLLMSPPAVGDKNILREYKIVRCELRPDGKYSIGMELIVGRSDIMNDLDPTPRKTGSQLKLILLAFALVGLLIALFMPL